MLFASRDKQLQIKTLSRISCQTFMFVKCIISFKSDHPVMFHIWVICKCSWLDANDGTREQCIYEILTLSLKETQNPFLVHRAIKSYLRSVHTHPRMYKHGHILVLKTFISKTLSTIFQKDHSCVSTCVSTYFSLVVVKYRVEYEMIESFRFSILYIQ